MVYVTRKPLSTFPTYTIPPEERSATEEVDPEVVGVGTEVENDLTEYDFERSVRFSQGSGCVRWPFEIVYNGGFQIVDLRLTR